MRDDPQVVPHVLRHTCASRLAQSGVDIKRIQEFLGHRTLSMTLRYAHLSPKHLDICADGEVLKLLGICRRCILRGDSSSTGFSL